MKEFSERVEITQGNGTSVFPLYNLIENGVILDDKVTPVLGENGIIEFRLLKAYDEDSLRDIVFEFKDHSNHINVLFDDNVQFESDLNFIGFGAGKSNGIIIVYEFGEMIPLREWSKDTPLKRYDSASRIYKDPVVNKVTKKEEGK